ncbi:MAG: TadE family protein [Chloroflexota bacterium]
MKRSKARGQTLVEFALVAPLFILTLAGIIIFGVGVFYQQQLTNAAREAARYAAIHSATSQCPTTSRLDPAWNRINDVNFDKNNYYSCDPPDLGWPIMTAHARSKVFGISASEVQFAACWSGYWDEDPVVRYDAPAINPDDGQPNDFHECTIGGIDPREDTGSLPCPPPPTVLAPADPDATDDKASNLAATAAHTANQVTVYACYRWSPPFIGSLVGGTVTMQAVITEAMQHQK